MDNIDLVISQKQKELAILQNEMMDALQVKHDMDYEFAAILYPIIGDLKREIQYLQRLQSLANPAAEQGFDAHLHQLMNENWRSLTIGVEVLSYYGYSGPIIRIEKMERRFKIKCSISIDDHLENFFYHDVGLELIHLGWTAHRRNTLFQYKTRLKNDEDFNSFHVWMSKTLLGPLRGLWNYAHKQYYLLSLQ